MIPQNKPVHGFHRLSHLSTLGNHLGRQKSHLSAEPWPLNPAFLLPLLSTRTLRHPGPCLYRYIPLLGFALHDDCVLLRVLVFLQTSFSDCHHHRPVSGSFFLSFPCNVSRIRLCNLPQVCLVYPPFYTKGRRERTDVWKDEKRSYTDICHIKRLSNPLSPLIQDCRTRRLRVLCLSLLNHASQNPGPSSGQRV